MTFVRLVVLVAGLLALASGAQAQGEVVSSLGVAAADPGVAAADRQILVMLPLAPPRYRPGGAYAGVYDPAHGSVQRRRVADALAATHGLRVVGEWPMPSLGVDCFVMEAGEPARRVDTAEALASDPRVESAQVVQRFETLGHDDPLYRMQPAAQRWHLDELHAVTTGRDTRIAEIDSGVDLAHPDLVGQIELAENFVDGRPYAAESHGTAVAGIIAARADDGVGIAGIAPGARLLALRACWEDGAASQGSACTSFTLAKALQFAILQKPHIINLSVGGPGDRLLDRLLDAALGAGIVVVGADDPRDASAWPAAHAGVLRVASDGDARGGRDALRAPGRDVPAPVPGATWRFLSGSSYAAAHVSGIVALLHELDRGIGPQRAASLLRDPRYAGVATDSGLVDACSAIERVTRSSVCVTLREARSGQP